MHKSRTKYGKSCDLNATIWLVFSRRLNWDLRPNPISALLQQKRAAGAPILDLTESNPTRAGFHYDFEIVEALADPRALRYEPSARGIESAREAVAQYYAERGRIVEPSQILLTASTSEAYAYLFKLLCDPGDEILAPRPSYPLFEFLADLESVRVRQYPLRYDGAWHVDFASLEAAITDRTRAIVVVDPNNPTGSFLKTDEAERLQSLAASRGLAILIDEVFADYRISGDVRDGVPAHALTFSMSGLSKIAGLPQMKLGWIVASGSGCEAALERLELIADTYLSVATPVQLALPKMLAASKSVRAQIVERTRANLELLKSITAGSPAQALHVEGGWNAILQIPRARTEEQWTLSLLSEHGVLVQPGYFFDFESEAFLVISLLTHADAFEAGIRAIRDATM
jgi:alanine-synthesizing transaminase